MPRCQFLSGTWLDEARRPGSWLHATAQARGWLGADGTPLIEQYEITGMDHGIPLDPGTGEGESGAAGAHMLDVGLSSTDRIAAFFGISPAVADKAAGTSRAAASRRPARQRVDKRPGPAIGVQAVIEKALKAAGLMG